jgi:hypothetical protein
MKPIVKDSLFKKEILFLFKDFIVFSQTVFRKIRAGELTQISTSLLDSSISEELESSDSWLGGPPRRKQASTPTTETKLSFFFYEWLLF